MKKQWMIGERYGFFVPLFAFILITIGAYLTVSNAFTWAKGYMAVETTSANTNLQSNEKEEGNKGEDFYSGSPQKGERIGKITIPKLGASVPVYEGTSDDELGKGAGHFSESVLPGENNNSVISGHRDTVFRSLGEVGEDDLIQVETNEGEFTYRVEKVRIVDANDRTVIVPKPEATLTVTTCYPFDFIGDAPERYVLVAKLIESKSVAR
ncbi:MAG TPA: class D sortase [Bacillus bacterium]|nr:class D sortase [Bacillus sp. (in: firmicutes)]